LIAALWSLAGARRGSPISQKEMSQHLGLSEPALSDWMSRNAELKQIEVLLRLFEMVGIALWLPELSRRLLVTPTLEDPELAYNPVAISRLRAILRERSGLTFVLGPDESARAWVFAALGHACAGLDPHVGRVVGMDILRPDWFRAIPGVVYLSHDDPGDQMTLRQKVEKYWSALGFNEAQVVLVNGLWSSLPEKRQELVAFATTKQIFVADRSIGSRSALGREFASLPSPTHLIEVRRLRPPELSIEFV
jgi:transcriptional regulator with XRE-family HTH domain